MALVNMNTQFVETIKIKSGRAMLLGYHQARMERTIRRFFPRLAVSAMPGLEQIVEATADMELYKARIVYGEQGVELVEYVPYSMRQMHSLKVVCDDDIEYSYKSTDRSRLNALVEKKGCCDEIVIIKNGLVTDTSFTNIAIYDGTSWLTPKHPLLAGTKRACLLDRGAIKEADITINDLMRAKRLRLFNAMIDFGEREIPISQLDI